MNEIHILSAFSFFLPKHWYLIAAILPAQIDDIGAQRTCAGQKLFDFWHMAMYQIYLYWRDRILISELIIGFDTYTVPKRKYATAVIYNSNKKPAAMLRC